MNGRRVLAGMLSMLALLLAAPVFAADTVYYYSSDTRHSEVVITDADRNVVERTYYAPYGAVLNRDLRDGPGYSGHEEDPETGLVYMQQRYYCPQCGRFLSVDPVGVDPTSGGNFNRYEYANDNPYRYTDPDGRESGAGYATGEYTMALPPSSPEARDAALTMVGVVVVVAGSLGADEAVGAGVALRAGVRYVGSKIAGAVTRRAASAAETADKASQVVRTTRSGEKAVRITRADGSVKDISPTRVKEYVPNTHPNAPKGTLQRVQFKDAQPGSKGFKRDPTPEELKTLKHLP